MPAQETSHRYQTAVLWPADGYDSYGQPDVGDPEEIVVRWNDRRTRMLSPTGATIAVDATAVVAQDIEIGSRLWLGSIDDLSGVGSGGIDILDILSPHRPFSFDDGGDVTLTDVMEVKAFSDIKDVRGRETTRKVGMIRLREKVTV